MPEPFLEQAQDDATLLAIRDMERAGIDIVTDGEMRRESYSNRFATALDGIDVEHPGESQARSARRRRCRAWSARSGARGPVEVRDMQFLRANTDRAAKITLPGPFTMGQQAKNEFYKDAEAMAMDFAAPVNEEAHELVKAGADVIQLDEPWLRNDPEEAKRYAVQGDQPGARGHHRADRRAPLLRLRGGGAGPTKPTGYSFLPQLADSIAQQISIEAAQPKLDLGVLDDLAPQEDHAGRDRPRRPRVETPQTGRRAHPRRPEVRAARQAPARARLRHEVPAARDRLRQAEGAGRGRRHRARGAVARVSWALDQPWARGSIAPPAPMFAERWILGAVVSE